MRAINKSTGRTLAGRVVAAETWLSRSRGLLGRDELPVGEGLLLRPCRGVHTFFMRFPIDVVFLDRSQRVVATVGRLKPGRMTRIFLKAGSALELPAGTIALSLTRCGDEVVVG
uniref:DUF192 domain-containing protein n=1 Tax=Geobacter sp. (strain M21) TaxID=443144 RepID=C6E417_GEOSM